MDRIERWHISIPWSNLDLNNRRKYLIIKKFLDCLIPKRKFPKGFRPFGSDTWCIFHKDALVYIKDFLDNKPAFIQFFKYVKIPDEIFYATILMNSEKKHPIEDKLLTFRDWTIELLTTKDFELLVNRSEFFARRFNIEIDSNILDLLDSFIDS
jgi:hypothetical protein